MEASIYELATGGIRAKKAIYELPAKVSLVAFVKQRTKDFNTDTNDTYPMKVKRGSKVCTDKKIR